MVPRPWLHCPSCTLLKILAAQDWLTHSDAVAKLLTPRTGAILNNPGSADSTFFARHWLYDPGYILLTAHSRLGTRDQLAPYFWLGILDYTSLALLALRSFLETHQTLGRTPAEVLDVTLLASHFCFHVPSCALTNS